MEDGSEEKLKVNLRWTVEAILLYGLWDRTSVTAKEVIYRGI